jgi:hypothetical protein
MLSNTFVAGRMNLTPSGVSKLVSRGRLEAETRKIADDGLPNVKWSSAEREVWAVTGNIEFACNEEHIITKGRKKNKAREVAIHLTRDLSGVSCKDLGLYFGGVSGVLITIMSNRITKEVEKNQR